ncbi:MAG: Carbonic anhydrase, beta class, partial [uncultured Propionibacteriaceae bacterium]
DRAPLRRPAGWQQGIRGQVLPGRLRRHCACRSGHGDLHGLPDRAAGDGGPQRRRRQDHPYAGSAPHPRRPGRLHPWCPSAWRGPDPAGPPHPLRDGHRHRRRGGSGGPRQVRRRSRRPPAGGVPGPGDESGQGRRPAAQQPADRRPCGGRRLPLRRGHRRARAADL